MKAWKLDELEEPTSRYPDEFVGKVDRVEWEDSEYGERLAVYIEPQNYAGEMRSWRYKYSQRRRSVWGKFLEALQKAGIEISSEDDLVGKTILWRMETIVFGVDRDGNEIATKMLTPIKEVSSKTEWTDEDIKKVLSGVTAETSVLDLMANTGIPTRLEKKVVMIASMLDNEGVISFEPTTMLLNKK